MYTLTLETNTLCNLNCRYCYLGEKTQKEMSLNVCKQSIDIAIHETNKQYDKTLFICFLGGEPLLSIDFIEDAVMYAKPLCEEKGLNILFGVTTNGTIYNNKIKKILLDHKFSIRVSIDGNEETQNLNRLDYYENGSYCICRRESRECTEIEPHVAVA